MPEDRAKTFLDLIRRAHRGRLKIYLGFAPGVGKTFQMLQEAHRLKADGVDVVVGAVEHHGRLETQRLIDGLESVPPRRLVYRGIAIEEMDLDAILTRKPQVVLVDELAHTNAPGSRNTKRYEDVRTLTAAGIHVISTLNVQHLESLYDTVERLLSVKVRERVPDALLAEADQVVNVDLAAEDLQRRLRDGKIYPQERVNVSLQNFFTESNLEQLRELTLREVASQLDLRRREHASLLIDADQQETDAHHANQVMVCLSSRGPNSARLLRMGSRLAGRLNRNWYAVYVQTPEEEPSAITAVTQRLLSETLTLANQLGATVFTFKGNNVSDTILSFAAEYRVGQIVIGSPQPIPRWQRILLGRRSVAEDLITRQKNVTVVVVDANAEAFSDGRMTERGSSQANASDTLQRERKSASTPGHAIKELLNADRVIFFDEPITYDQTIERLIDAIAAERQYIDRPSVLRSIKEREQRGSTILNGGIALPHARATGLETPIAALGLIRSGVLDSTHAIDLVFLLLVPPGDPANHLAILAAFGRLFSNQENKKQMRQSKNAVEVLSALSA